jgi:antitoxin component YwqK of YwqJK toxin-antitoxin module
MEGMKKLLAAMFVALLMAGCGEDIDVPKMIKCDGCKKRVYSEADDCPNCSYPVADSVVAYREEQELARIRAEEERKRQEEERKRQEEERKRQEELAKKRAKEVRKRAEEEAKPIAKSIGLDDYKIIAEAIDNENRPSDYTGWVKGMFSNGRISNLAQFKDGERDGLSTEWYINGQKVREMTLRDGKRDGLTTIWYPNGQKWTEETYKDGKLWTAIAWKPNGEKCPVTNVVNGNGILVHYSIKMDGTESFRTTYKDGIKVD